MTRHFLLLFLLVALAPDSAAAQAEAWWGHVTTLAHDSMRGRETGSPEHRKAAEYVAAVFQRTGLQPGGSDGWFQPVRFRVRRVNEGRSSLALVRGGGLAKGDVLAVAQVAGVMGAKRTPDLIPLCHPLPISGVELSFDFDESAASVEISATARVVGKTGVEMEALTAVSVAALTIYDMCKAVDKEMVIDRIRLVHKVGGKSGEFRRVEGQADGKSIGER